MPPGHLELWPIPEEIALLEGAARDGASIRTRAIPEGWTRVGRIGNFSILERTVGRRGGSQPAPSRGVVRPVYRTSKGDPARVVAGGDLFVRLSSAAAKAGGMARLLASVPAAGVEQRDARTALIRLERRADPVLVAQQLQRTWSAAELVCAEPGLTCGLALPVEPPRRRRAAVSMAGDAGSDGAMQWHLRNPGGVGCAKGADVRAEEAWSALVSAGRRRHGDRSVVVAVIDTGFDLAHPDLAGAVRPPVSRRGSNPTGQALALEGGGDPAQRSHGTAVAALIVGRIGRGPVRGVAPGCSLLPIPFGEPGAAIDDSSVERWFREAARGGAHVISCSWTPGAKVFPLSTRIWEAIADSAKRGRRGKGCVIVFAAGNSGARVDGEGRWNGFACHPDVIAVGASTCADGAAAYSAYGKCVPLCAPSSGGTHMVVTAAPGPALITSRFSGTSASCPLVAGAAALVLSANPALRGDEVRSILSTRARRPVKGASVPSFTTRFSGCVNAAAAVREAIRRRRR